MDRLRTAVLKAALLPRKEALADLARIQIAASKQKLMNAQVADENGELKSVQVFLNDRIHGVMA